MSLRMGVKCDIDPVAGPPGCASKATFTLGLP